MALHAAPAAAGSFLNKLLMCSSFIPCRVKETDALGYLYNIRYTSPDLVADAGRLSNVHALDHQTGAAVLQAQVAGEGRPTADADINFRLSLLELAVPDYASICLAPLAPMLSLQVMWQVLGNPATMRLITNQALQ